MFFWIKHDSIKKYFYQHQASIDTLSIVTLLLLIYAVLKARNYSQNGLLNTGMKEIAKSHKASQQYVKLASQDGANILKIPYLLEKLCLILFFQESPIIFKSWNASIFRPLLTIWNEVKQGLFKSAHISTNYQDPFYFHMNHVAWL